MHTTRMKVFGDSMRLDAAPRTLTRGGRPASGSGEGERVGSHPQGCKFSQDDDGTLHVTTARGDVLCDYPPAQYEMREGDGVIHVHKMGEHDNSRFKREPVSDRAPPVRVSPGSDPQREYAGLRQMNARAARLAREGFWR